MTEQENYYTNFETSKEYLEQCDEIPDEYRELLANEEWMEHNIKQAIQNAAPRRKFLLGYDVKFTANKAKAGMLAMFIYVAGVVPQEECDCPRCNKVMWRCIIPGEEIKDSLSAAMSKFIFSLPYILPLPGL